MPEKVDALPRRGRPRKWEADQELTSAERYALLCVVLGARSSRIKDLQGALGISQAAASRVRAGCGAHLDPRVVIERALLERSQQPSTSLYALPASAGRVPHPTDQPLEWMRRDDRLAGVTQGHTEPEETSRVPTYVRIDWLTVVGRVRATKADFEQALRSMLARIHPYARSSEGFQPYRWTAELAGGLLVHYGPRKRCTPDVTIDFTGRALEQGLAAGAFRHAIAPLLEASSVACTRLDVAVDYAVKPLRFLPFAHGTAPSRIFRPADKKEGYRWPSLHTGSVPNVKIGKRRASTTYSIYDKTAHAVDEFWHHAKPWFSEYFEPRRTGGGEWAAADLSTAAWSVRQSMCPAWPITESVRQHERVTRIEARVRLRSSKARSPVGLFSRLDNPFEKLGFIDLLAVKNYNSLYYRALLQARLVGLDSVVHELDGLGGQIPRSLLRRLAALPSRGGLDSPATVFERSRATLQRQLERIMGLLAEREVAPPRPHADFGTPPLYVPMMTPPMPPPRLHESLKPHTMLVDNRSRGARLVVVSAMEGARVQARDQRTGRRTSFQFSAVGGASSRYSIVPPDKTNEALQRMRSLRLKGQGGNVTYLSDFRGRDPRSTAVTASTHDAGPPAWALLDGRRPTSTSDVAFEMSRSSSARPPPSGDSVAADMAAGVEYALAPRGWQLSLFQR